MGRVLDFLFPLECVACGAPGAHACTACLAGIVPSPRFYGDGGVRTLAGFAYAQPLVRRLLHDAKYEGWTCALAALETLVRRAVRTGGGIFRPDALVAAVPLHPARFRLRGFNQAEALARALAAATDRRLAPGLLQRPRSTAAQTRAADRGANVRGAFACAPLPTVLRGRPFLLVDDVRTSGATLRECASALRIAGAGRVDAFTLAWGSGDEEGVEASRPIEPMLG